jgi:hypothetical protein
MILSVRNKYQGGFDYYRMPDTVPINDDFPVHASSVAKTRVGIPASLAARTLPNGAVRIGHGQFPKGSICSSRRGNWKYGGFTSKLVSGLSGVETQRTAGIGLILAGAIVLGIAAYISKEK